MPSFVLNGQPHDCAADTTVAALLESLKLAEKRVAIERNGSIVSKSQHASVVVIEGDRLEIVQAIGGG
jgi:sulfur carrier protein